MQARRLAHRLVARAAARAARSGLDFTLTWRDVAPSLERGACSLTGLPFSDRPADCEARANPYAPSIDRIDSTQGYTPDNCRVVVWAVNCAIGAWGEEVFSTIARSYLEASRG